MANAIGFEPVIDPTRLEIDELRELAADVIHGGFSELVYARTCVRAITERRVKCSRQTREQYVVRAREALHGLELDAEFYAGPALEGWASLLALDEVAVVAIRNRYEEQAAPVRAALREAMERAGAKLERRARECRRG